MSRILLIDDDEDLLKLLEAGLRKEGLEVVKARDGKEALRQAYEHHPDIVLLDIMLPGMDGHEICRRLREVSDAPIIMLTALSTEAQIIKGLSLGADDYITKPFRMGELTARVQAALRRSRGSAGRPTAVTVGELQVDFARHRVAARGKEIDLSPTEFQLLSYLVRHSGEVIPHRTLLTEVWGPEYAQELKYLHLYVCCLRRKIEEDPAHPRILKTDRGFGYYMDDFDTASGSALPAAN